MGYDFHVQYAADALCTLHQSLNSNSVQKKKAKTEIEDDLFSDAVEEDLVAGMLQKNSGVTKASEASLASTSKPAVNTEADKAAQAAKKRQLSEQSRIARFDQLCEFVAPRLGRKPSVKMPMVRKSAWVQLVQLATTEEQLTKVVDMLPGWNEAGNHFDVAFSELFVRTSFFKTCSCVVPAQFHTPGRCEELSCPLLALKVYGAYAKYNVPLSLPGARQLLHSVHVKHPIESVMTAAALYDVYDLPAVSDDLISCAMLMSACFKHNSKDSLVVANALVPHLQELLTATEPAKAETEGPVRSPQEKQNAWVKWALKKVDKALFVQNGQRVDWLSVWREKSGHIVAPGKF
ncbi:hypothetical protein H0H81_004081 [Sphagnurus paluster]|uniref:Uncharacterized protein n=1 Tax=Sphagnurus paluster TaxID=117069 RepID=A0A9P7KMK9_9AGAR|nr:hypothetical protein H0H81_004081 [Sphagnurus paluster]